MPRNPGLWAGIPLGFSYGDISSRWGRWSRFQRTSAASLVSSNRNCRIDDSTWPLPIPKGLRPPAQGCRVCEATLGHDAEMVSTATRLWRMLRAMTDGNGRNRVAVGNFLWTLTQGSSCLATLGFGAESRWDALLRRNSSSRECRKSVRGSW